ncbi:tetratricopeptide repeat protein [Candidatus Magnetomonas plexicatena]|uniref:tetratricopeptide repeat protein n=1 Tax=Candidatus Magnetomonas plexicatena TaxID=2552947 RepID=UPI001C754A3B|nr:tetratricopeptide repeat protein [Nitrospirales bacterium LBB_01]
MLALKDNLLKWMPPIAVLVSIAGIYFQVVHFDFINYDDPVYVTNNPLVLNGFTLNSFLQAFKTMTNGYWSPLVDISNMLAVSMCGLKAYGHHLINVVIHAAASIVLFYVIQGLFKTTGVSLFTALAFATHPMHVESVAWISERKDVLYALFFFISILLYMYYVKKPSVLKYLLILVAFIFSLISKPMAVSLPFVLLLFDIYPLERFKGSADRLTIIYEKIPFFLLSAIISVVTYIAQKSSGAVDTVTPIALSIRLSNAVTSLIKYISKLFFPVNMSILYPYDVNIALWKVLVCVILSAGITFVALYDFLKKRRPYIFIGWFFYLVTVAPVIGIVQSGAQSMADRYTYVPYVGLFIIIACLVSELTVRFRRYRVTAILAIIAMMLISYKQISYWRNSETILRHSISVTENNYILYNNLADTLLRQWKISEAVNNYSAAISIKPDFADSRAGIGITYMYAGNTEKALENLNLALQLNSRCIEAYMGLGTIMSSRGQFEAAFQYFNKALTISPNSALLRYNLGITYFYTGKPKEALENLNLALQLNPYDAKTYFYIGNVYASTGKLTEAENAYRKALQLQPNYPDAMVNLGNVLIYERRFDEAVNVFTAALSVSPVSVEAYNGLGSALMLKGDIQRAIEAFQKAVSIRPDFKDALTNLEIAKKRAEGGSR